MDPLFYAPSAGSGIDYDGSIAGLVTGMLVTLH